MNNSVSLALATGNQGKVKEIKALLKEFPVDIKTLAEFGPIPEVEEDGDTFDENAYKKASFTARVLGLPAMADDSGLVVHALGGVPGVRSARYAGENASDKERCEKLIKEMRGLTDRKAKFECVISIAVPTGPALTYEGSCKGLIIDKPVGTNGFGYDPVFLYPGLKKTFAELSGEEKSLVSHRGKALREIRNEFDKINIWINQNMPG